MQISGIWKSGFEILRKSHPKGTTDLNNLLVIVLSGQKYICSTVPKRHPIKIPKACPIERTSRAFRQLASSGVKCGLGTLDQWSENHYYLINTLYLNKSYVYK